jgi:hypothetical protein
MRQVGVRGDLPPIDSYYLCPNGMAIRDGAGKDWTRSAHPFELQATTSRFTSVLNRRPHPLDELGLICVGSGNPSSVPSSIGMTSSSPDPDAIRLTD